MANLKREIEFPKDYNKKKVDSRTKIRSSMIRDYKAARYGGDIREAMADGVDISSVIATEANDSSKSAKLIANDTQNRFDVQINGQDKDNESKDARVSKADGKTYNILKDRLDAMDKKSQQAVDDLEKSLTGLATMRRLGQMYNSPGSAGADAQGFTALESETVVQYFQNTGGFDEQQGTLKKFNVKTGAVLATNVIKGYHGNSLSYNKSDGFIYMAMAEDTSGVDTAQKTKLLKINPNDLSISETIDLTSKTKLPIVHCVGYDSVNNLFVIGDNKTIEFYNQNWEFEFSTQLQEVIGYAPGYMQGVQVNDDMLYWIGGRRSQVWVFKTDIVNKTVDFKTQYVFDDFQEGLYPTGEIEGIGFNEDEIYIASNVSISGWRGLSEYFITTDKFKTAISGPQSVPINFSNAENASFYVGSNMNYNPDGTQTNPFASLLEAESCMMSNDIHAKTLVLLNNMSEDLIMSSLNNVTIKGNGHSVRAIVVSNSDGVSIINTNTRGYSGYKNCAVYVYNSNLTMEDYMLTSLGNKFDYEIILDRCIVRLAGNNSDSRIHTINSRLYSNLPVKGIFKDNDKGLVIGDFDAGIFTNINNPTGLTMTTMLHYSRLKAAAVVTVDGKKLGFRLERTLTRTVPIANLSGYTISSNVLYFIMIHYVRDTPSYSTVSVFKLPSFESASVSSYNVHFYLSDN